MRSPVSSDRTKREVRSRCDRPSTATAEARSTAALVLASSSSVVPSAVAASTALSVLNCEIDRGVRPATPTVTCGSLAAAAAATSPSIVRTCSRVTPVSPSCCDERAPATPNWSMLITSARETLEAGATCCSSPAASPVSLPAPTMVCCIR
eukprot:scaffold9409_cov116-Isochrysis_galbana.AAC.17